MTLHYHSANFLCIFILDGTYGVSNLSAWIVFYSFMQHNIKISVVSHTLQNYHFEGQGLYKAF